MTTASRPVRPLLPLALAMACAASAPGQSCKDLGGLVQAAPLSLLNDTQVGTANLGSVPVLLYAGSQQTVYGAEIHGKGREIVRVTGNPPRAEVFELSPGISSSLAEAHGEFSNGSVLLSYHKSSVRGRGLVILPVTGQPIPVDTGGGNLVDFSGAAPLSSAVYLLRESEFRGATRVELLRIDPAGQSTVIRDFSGAGTPVAAGDVTRSGNGLLLAVEFTDGTAFFTSDGTATGTVEIERIKDARRVRFRGEISGNPVFTMHTKAFGDEPWITDGTKGGARLLSDIRTGPDSSFVRGVVQFSATQLLFHAVTGANGREPWTTDGTPTGTAMVKDVRPGAEDGIDGNFVMFQGAAWFNGDDGTTGKELWRTDGTAAGTKLHQDRIPGIAGLDPKSLCVVNALLFFSGLDPSAGLELHRTDGTVAGTNLVKDLNPGINSTFAYDLSRHGNLLLFCGMDSLRGEEVLQSDGTAAGTSLAFDLNPTVTRTAGSNPSGFVTSLSDAFFAANDPKYGMELYRTDGTTTGTSLVVDLMPGSAGSDIQYITPLPEGGVIFAANGGSGREPYTSDGTAAGTRLLQDIMTGSGSSDPGPFVGGGDGWTFYPATDRTLGRELHGSNAELARTLLVGDINKGPGSSNPGEFALLPGRGSQGPVIVMAAGDGSTGRELWGLDVWTRSIRQIADINPGQGSSNPTLPVVMRGNCYFVANDSTHGDELWKSNGTAAGTVLVKDIAAGSTPGLQRFGPRPVEFKDLLFFAAFDRTNGLELWRSDGTAPGTRLFVDLVPGIAGSTPQNLTVAGDKLFFTTMRSTSNGAVFDLWFTDGTPSGTEKVRGAGNVPTRLFAVGNRVYYAAVPDGIPFLNQELLLSDGTRRGTFLVGDIAPGLPTSRPGAFAIVNGRLVFAADNAIDGPEPWVVARPGPTAEPIGTGCGPMFPELRITPPVPGEAITFAGRNAPDNSTGILVLSAATGAPWKLDGCQVYVDPNTMFPVHMFTTSQGSWSHKVPIPADPSLLDAPLIDFQSAYEVLGRRLILSNAVRTRF